MSKVYLTGLSSPVSSPDLCPAGSACEAAETYELPDGTVLVLHPAFAGPVAVDSAPEVETLREVQRAIARALDTREKRAAAGRLTEEDAAAIEAERLAEEAEAKRLEGVRAAEEAQRRIEEEAERLRADGAKQAAAAAAWEAEKLANESPGARAKRLEREAAASGKV